MGILKEYLEISWTTVAGQMNQYIALMQNNTVQLKTLSSCQAISGGFQAVSLTVLFLYLGILMIRAIIRCVAKKQEAKQEQMLEMMERSLQERKSKRKLATTRAMAARPDPMEQ